jgi:hypothetical protein
VHDRPRERAELWNPPSHVVAVRVEAPGLRQWSQQAVATRVRSRAGDPLPVPGVTRDVAVHEQIEEHRRSGAPVDAEVPREEGPDDEARSVREPSFEGELAHAGIDDGIPGEPAAPALEGVVIRAQVVSAGMEVTVRGFGVPREELMEEVPPAELTDEVVGIWVLVRTRNDLEWREAPEVEVGAEPRRSVDIEPIPAPGVRRQPVGEPACETPAPFALAPSSNVGRRCPTGQLMGRQEF